MPDPDWEVRSHLQQYLLGDGDLRTFQAWFKPVAWRAGEDHSASPLVGAIELYLAEFTNGHRTEPELRGLFAGLLEGAMLTTRAVSETPWTSPLEGFWVDKGELVSH
jgi:hypothetical protein